MFFANNNNCSNQIGHSKVKQRYIMGLVAAHPIANGALLDHPEVDNECLHSQSHDVLQEKLLRDWSYFPVAHGCQHYHRSKGGFAWLHVRVVHWAWAAEEACALLRSWILPGHWLRHAAPATLYAPWLLGTRACRRVSPLAQVDGSLPRKWPGNHISDRKSVV